MDGDAAWYCIFFFLLSHLTTGSFMYCLFVLQIGLYCQPLLAVYNDVVVKSRMKFVWSILQFCSTKPTDSGQYTCIADNEFINNRTTFQLTHSWFVVPRITEGCATIHSLWCYDMYAMSPHSPQTSWSCVVDQNTLVSAGNTILLTCICGTMSMQAGQCLLGVYNRRRSTPPSTGSKMAACWRLHWTGGFK